MATALKRYLYSFEEFCFLVHEDQKADLIDGVIYMASPENLDANKLYGWLFWLIAGFIEGKGLGGELFGSRVAFRINKTSSPEPDIGYLLEQHLHREREG